MAIYEIAGVTVDMQLTGRTARQAEPYRIQSGGQADMVIRCDAQRTLELNPQLEDLDMAEYIATGTIFARNILKYDGFQLHACAVGLEGKAYLFSAPCGMGKSTHGEKWCRLFGATLMNDDKPILRHTESGWMVYGTPWSGKHDLSAPIGLPLGGIACLYRGETNAIVPMDTGKAVTAIMSQCLRNLSGEQMHRHLELLDKLLRQKPIWQLTCRNDDAAALLSREAMTK